MRLILFIIRIGKEASKDDLFAMAGQLTYKMLLAFFPFLIFLISLLGFANLDGRYWMQTLSAAIPAEAGRLLDVFFDEVINVRSVGVLSVSLLVSLYNASSGFFVVIRCVNQTYGYKNCRHFLVNQLVSIALVIMFALSLTSMLTLLIFNDNIFAFAERMMPSAPYVKPVFAFVGLLITAGVLLITTMMIYKLSNCKNPRLFSVMPGAVVTVSMWIVSSKIFNLYINNFARYSKVYGSIAGVFILIMWLNIISTVLLLGSEINSMLDKSAESE
ncbi:MAG: YihY/virulence factor BrkB family protein [Clostridiales bacterium]|jgi:membrane protein|nr:YihY/virulence factor BrkB family protein [Clostridiales bacterium]